MEDSPYGYDPMAQAQWEERRAYLAGHGVPAPQAIALADLDPELRFADWLLRLRLLLDPISTATANDSERRSYG